MKIQNYRQSRNVPSLDIVPAKLRKNMLRNCLRFEVVVYREDNYHVFYQNIENGLDEHTTKLFHLKVRLQETEATPRLMYVSVFFEKFEDMERFQKHFMVLQKLSHTDEDGTV